MTGWLLLLLKLLRHPRKTWRELQKTGLGINDGT